MEQKTTQLDASTGFADIKALPEFFVSSSSTYTFLGLGLFAFTALLLSLYLLRHKFFSSKAKVRLNPFTNFKNELTSLEQAWSSKSIPTKDFSERLSLKFRELIAEISNYPADDRTSSEVYQELPDVLEKLFPLQEDGWIKEINQKVSYLLKDLGKLTYASLNPQADNALLKPYCDKALAISEDLKLATAMKEQQTKKDLASK